MSTRWDVIGEEEVWSDPHKKLPTIKQLKEALEKFPDDAIWWANQMHYNGAACGIIVEATNGDELGVIYNDGDVELMESDPDSEG